MLLIPQLYLRDKKVVALERTTSPLYDKDPIVMCQKIKGEGGEAVYIIDLGISNIGHGENVPVVRKIRDELGLTVYVGGDFKSARSVETYMAIDIKAVVLDGVAYQQPLFVREICNHFPERIGVKISVRGGRVTIPGWAVAPHKTALDYADQFNEMGVTTFFYSDVGDKGTLTPDSLNNILLLCKKIERNVICTSEIAGMSDIEKLVTLGAPGLDGLVVAHSLYENKIDLKSAIALISDLSLAPGNEPTIREE